MGADDVRLVVTSDRGLTWAVHADDVREIVDAGSWRGEPPVDVARRWRSALPAATPAADGATDPEGAPASARALVVHTAAGRRALLSPQVSFRTVERARVMPLPRRVAWGRGAAMVEGIVFGDADEALFILNPDGFVDGERPATEAGSRTHARTSGRRDT